ncbi:OmpP1/FadL family transporter [Acinetobacter piscicola]|uniref:OmpP1/FadL family transporter n=1 Tax=Acinetobacter piscicola TaxID=2006115 RepID=UPI000B7F23B0|nr:outer membrane protein transport protein [Acinetobacter piscicola]
MKISLLKIVLSSSFIIPIFSYAAAIEKSDQSILPFLESDNYLELSYAELYADVSGQVQNQQVLQQIGVQNFSTGNLVDDYHFANVAAKFQIHPQFSFGVIYDQPYGVDLSYDYHPQSMLGKQTIESTNLKFKSESISMLVGYQPTLNWNIYTGAVYQQFEGELDVFGPSYSVMSGYQAKFKQSSGHGWLAGLSYQIPEYAVKTAITYRSKITHQAAVTEDIFKQPLNVIPSAKTEITTPQSVSLDIQTGLTPKNVLYSNLRWVNWKDFEIQPRQFGAVVDLAAQQYPDLIKPFNLIDYNNDQWSAKLGLAHVFTDQWVSFTDLSWDSGSGNPASTLNPSDGFYGFGLGALYKFHKKSFIAYGLKYFKFNKADVKKLDTTNAVTQNGTLSSVSNNDAFAHGIRIGYYF